MKLLTTDEQTALRDFLINAVEKYDFTPADVDTVENFIEVLRQKRVRRKAVIVPIAGIAEGNAEGLELNV